MHIGLLAIIGVSMQEKLGEKIQKQEAKELEKVKQLAQDLQDKQFRYVFWKPSIAILRLHLVLNSSEEKRVMFDYSNSISPSVGIGFPFYSFLPSLSDSYVRKRPFWLLEFSVWNKEKGYLCLLRFR